MPARFPNTLALVALLTLPTLLAACAPTRAPEKGRSEETSMPVEADITSDARYHVELLDPVRQLYRYGSGACRELGKLPPPWREYDSKRYEKRGALGQRFQPGYSWGPMISVDTTELILEAEYAELGLPPTNTLPGNYQRFGLAGNVALLGLGRSLGKDAPRQMRAVQEALLAAQPDWRPQQPIPFKNRWGEERAYVPMKAPFPVSDRFGVYAEGPDYVSEKSDLVIINPALRAGVYCDNHHNWPNGSCKGVILLGDGEVATIRVSYEALGTLQEVVESMIHAAHAIRVGCPEAGDAS